MLARTYVTDRGRHLTCRHGVDTVKLEKATTTAPIRPPTSSADPRNDLGSATSPGFGKDKFTGSDLPLVLLCRPAADAKL
jgi:hypothetical protein